MRVTCKHCGGPHPAFECRKKSTGKRVGPREPLAGAVDFSLTPGPGPVDTNSSGVIAAHAVPLAGPGSAEGRPAAKFDKKAYMKTYMKTYMARYREDVKSGKRAPKKKVKAS